MRKKWRCSGFRPRLAGVSAQFRRFPIERLIVRIDGDFQPPRGIPPGMAACSAAFISASCWRNCRTGSAAFTCSRRVLLSTPPQLSAHTASRLLPSATAFSSRLNVCSVVLR